MDADECVRLVARALAGDEVAIRRLVDLLTPVIQARVARTLCARRWVHSGGRNLRQEVEDLTQDVFLLLFAKDGRQLRRWQPDRGLSLENFVGLVTERYVVSYLRSGRRNPSKEELLMDDDFDRPAPEPGPLQIVAGREELELLLDRMRESSSPLGWQIFELFFIQGLSVSETADSSGLSKDAVYAWISRLRKLARELMEELSGKPGPSRTPPEEEE